MKTLPTYDPTLFEGAATYYTQYRPKYPDALFTKLTEIFNISGQGQLLDLGCGPGLLAIPLRTQFEHVVGIDPDPEMLREAQQQAEAVGTKNITWLEQGAEFISSDLGVFKLVTIGRAFHWMEREVVLQRSYELLSDDGGLAIISTQEDPWRSSQPWKQSALTVVKKWLGEQRRTGKRGQGFWTEPNPPHTEVLAQSPFPRQALYKVPFEQSWTISTFIGYLYSTAFCLQIFLGDNVKQFEADLKETLLAIEPSGQFKEEITVSVLAAWKH
ncbi:MAG: class I SAM-dependent methyltransferase [Chroococcidiopsidaceae cyanobacterium CP_BM_ER_R8_30]|nr:class I SAM-dependent methyltransferase [Chroococcidiopsidaceae cyanobacterium CP_BM_ER_R8_30]